jgi:hypothetical protein
MKTLTTLLTEGKVEKAAAVDANPNLTKQQATDIIKKQM